MLHYFMYGTEPLQVCLIKIFLNKGHIFSCIDRLGVLQVVVLFYNMRTILSFPNHRPTKPCFISPNSLRTIHMEITPGVRKTPEHKLK